MLQGKDPWKSRNKDPNQPVYHSRGAILHKPHKVNSAANT